MTKFKSLTTKTNPVTGRIVVMSRYEATVRHADKFAGPTSAQVSTYNTRLAVAHAESGRQYRTGPRYGQQLARTVDAISPVPGGAA